MSVDPCTLAVIQHLVCLTLTAGTRLGGSTIPPLRRPAGCLPQLTKGAAGTDWTAYLVAPGPTWPQVLWRLDRTFLSTSLRDLHPALTVLNDLHLVLCLHLSPRSHLNYGLFRGIMYACDLHSKLWVWPVPGFDISLSLLVCNMKLLVKTLLANCIQAQFQMSNIASCEYSKFCDKFWEIFCHVKKKYLLSCLLANFKANRHKC